MSDHQFIVTDIDYQPYKEDRAPSRSSVKEENNKEEDILLFDENITFNPNHPSFDIENLDSVQLTDSSFNISFTDEQMSRMLSGDTLVKLPTDINTMYKGDLKADRPLSHMVKYKMQDGKHTKVWQCGVCSKEFGHQYILMRHLPTHTDERKFQCNTCGKAFRQMSTLSQHRAIHSADRPYVCEICQKTFNRVSTLISHRKTHTGLKPHRCHLCNKAFHQKGNLRNHIFTHTNERPYKCDVCFKGFNQMSNLMCHKLKAHQRCDKPRYTCQTCGKDFLKRMGLRNHEQYEHGDIVSDGPNGVPRIRYTNGVIVDPINTAAMQHALSTNQTPFALLRPLNGIPVLVRVLAAGNKQMLVPATAEDLKKHGQITITPKIEPTESCKDEESKEENVKIGEVHENGSTVQIKIPVVATVIQRCGKDGNMCMDVESPGPGTEGMLNDNYMYTTSAGMLANNGVMDNGMLNNNMIVNNGMLNGNCTINGNTLNNAILNNDTLNNNTVNNSTLNNSALNGAITNGAITNGALTNGALNNSTLTNITQNNIGHNNYGPNTGDCTLNNHTKKNKNTVVDKNVTLQNVEEMSYEDKSQEAKPGQSTIVEAVGNSNKNEIFDLTIGGDDKGQFFPQTFSYTSIVNSFNKNMELDGTTINLDDSNNDGDNTVHLYSSSDEVFDLTSDTRIYQLLDKPQEISITETNTVLDSSSFLNDSSLTEQTFTIV